MVVEKKLNTNLKMVNGVVVNMSYAKKDD